MKPTLDLVLVFRLPTNKNTYLEEKLTVEVTYTFTLCTAKPAFASLWSHKQLIKLKSKFLSTEIIDSNGCSDTAFVDKITSHRQCSLKTMM